MEPKIQIFSIETQYFKSQLQKYHCTCAQLSNMTIQDVCSNNLESKKCVPTNLIAICNTDDYKDPS
jgi:hypothetical protein